MKIKPIAEAVLYALAAQRYGAMAWRWELGIHARAGLILSGEARQDRLQRLVASMHKRAGAR